MVYKADLENAIKSHVDDAIKQAGVSKLVDDDAVLQAVPEYSAVGEPVSNGNAERAVRMLEDQIRTLKRAFGSANQRQSECPSPSNEMAGQACSNDNDEVQHGKGWDDAIQETEREEVQQGNNAIWRVRMVSETQKQREGRGRPEMGRRNMVRNQG